MDKREALARLDEAIKTMTMLLEANDAVSADTTNHAIDMVKGFTERMQKRRVEILEEVK